MLNLKTIKLGQKIIACLGLFYLLLAYSIPALALSSDNQQPAHFIADHVVYNYKDGITIFTGNVKLNQGTTQLIADQVTTYTNKDGKIDKAIATGTGNQLAHYSTLPDNQDQIVDVFGERIEYYPLDKQAVVIGSGTITQGQNRFNGSHIVYDMQKQVVTSLPVPDQQSVIIVQPQNLPGKAKNQSKVGSK